MTTHPVTTSPFPFRSEIPRRSAGPICTSATSPTVTGVPPGPMPTDTLRMSSSEVNRPRPRTTYSAPPASSTRPPTSALEARTASVTFWMDRLYACSFAGSTCTWYSFSYPPNDAISATPGTAVSAGRTVKSCRARKSDRLSAPLVSASTYCITQPTPVASGPSVGRASGGSLPVTPFRYSSTRERAQYRSVPSSNTTYTAEMPNWLIPRTNLMCGTLSSSVSSGYVT